ncbi:DUF397 domain-containing protein [Spongiactinospora rosea]|uniref:DUF397 domain-containing protein n=1 Tax=Spongiactinospora rosea TaxID=2248750 RepID=A0A366M7K2_9ACTN|nr:DUF397 domain-containing protein [Spongiactinospora rosea]RBQ21442.1 DUF397 domain-containing protein [Spongiactinospora rosea]
MDLSSAEWHKSTRSQGANNNCVEVARNLPGVIAVRDSKDPHGPKLLFTPAEWAYFLSELRGGSGG